MSEVLLKPRLLTFLRQSLCLQKILKKIAKRILLSVIESRFPMHEYKYYKRTIRNFIRAIFTHITNHIYKYSKNQYIKYLTPQGIYYIV